MPLVSCLARSRVVELVLTGRLSAELDLIPGIGTFVLCLTLPIELGILTGVVVNIIFILYHAARPKFSVELLKVSASSW